MFLSKIQDYAVYIKHFTGLSSDALFIYTGLIFYFLIAAIHKRQLKSNIAMIAVVLLAISIEVFSSRSDIFGHGYWRVGASIHNIVNMIIWPYIIWAMAKFHVWKG